MIGTAPASGDLFLGGETVRRRAGPLWAALRALLHLSLLFVPWAILQAVARFFVGLRRRASVTLGPDGLTVRRETTLLGRRIAQAETFHPYRAVLAVGRAKRYRYLHLLIGLLCLTVGGAIGIVAIHDGIAGGYAPLALSGFGLLGLGLVIDLSLNVLVPTARRRAVVEIRLPREDLWISGVEDDLAEAFVADGRRALSGRPRASAVPAEPAPVPPPEPSSPAAESAPGDDDAPSAETPLELR